MSDKKRSTPSEKKSISISGDVRDSTISIGDNNIFQKIIIKVDKALYQSKHTGRNRVTAWSEK